MVFWAVLGGLATAYSVAKASYDIAKLFINSEFGQKVIGAVKVTLASLPESDTDFLGDRAQRNLFFFPVGSAETLPLSPRSFRRLSGGQSDLA